MPHVLLVDDDPNLRGALARFVGRHGHQVSQASDAAEGVAQIQKLMPDLVITDMEMPGGTGFLVLDAGLRAKVPVVILTAHASVEMAVDAMKRGAANFLTKPFNSDTVAEVLNEAFGARGAQRSMTPRAPTPVMPATGGRTPGQGTMIGAPVTPVVGEDEAFRNVLSIVERIADTDATILLTGESGTGKEVVARAIHNASKRRDRQFVAVNCGAIPEALLESELFGHVKGAFTDARGTRTGLFAKANGGTLFLDEVAEMPLGMQAKLLRALQERTVRMVGGDTEVPFDTRIVAATNRDLEKEVAQKRFREDLFHRLDVVRIHVPPLRDRENDTLRLAQHFLRRSQGAEPRIVGLTRAAADRLTSHSWPGNVRELQNCMERAVVLAQFDHIGIEDLPERISECKPTALPFASVDSDRLLPMDEIEQRYIRQVLSAVGGNKASAARVLGLDRRTLYRKLDRWREGSEGSEVDSNGAATL